MSKLSDFLNQCGVCYLLTMDGDYPTGRPLGAAMEYQGKLYLSTSNGQAMYQPVLQNPHCSIIALKSGSREWLRLKGLVKECTDLAIKQHMMDEYPILSKHFPSADCDYFALLEITVQTAAINSDAGVEQLL